MSRHRTPGLSVDTSPGKSMNEHNETEFFLSLGNGLVQSGLLPVPEIFEKYGVSMPVISGVAIVRAAKKWDRLIGMLQARSDPNLHADVAIAGFLRLLVIDWALRVFALLRMCKTLPPNPDIPSWACENGGQVDVEAGGGGVRSHQEETG